MPAATTIPATRFHVGLNVADLGRSVQFYRLLLGVEPARQYDDYARFELEQPPLVLALALVHHLCISGNVPPELVVEQLRALGAPVVLEVPHADDVMVRRLLARKRPHQHDDFTVERFGQLLLPRFDVTDRLELHRRTLLLLDPRRSR